MLKSALFPVPVSVATLVRRPRRLWCAAALLSISLFSPYQLSPVAAEGPRLLGDGTASISTGSYDLHTTVNGTGPPPRWWSCPSRWEWASLTSTADLGSTDLPALSATAAHVGGDPAECHPFHTLPVYTGSGVALYGRGWKRRRHSEAAAYALAHTITRHDPLRAFVIPENAYSCGGGRLLLGADSLLLFVVAPSEEELEALNASRPGAADYYEGVPPGMPVLLYVHGEHPSRDPVCVYVAGEISPSGAGGGHSSASPTPSAEPSGSESSVSGVSSGSKGKGTGGGEGGTSSGLSAGGGVAVAAGAMLVGLAAGAGIATAWLARPRRTGRPDRRWAAPPVGGALGQGLGASGGGVGGDLAGARSGMVSNASATTSTASDLVHSPSALDQWEPEGREDGLAAIVPPESRYSVEPVSGPLPKA